MPTPSVKGYMPLCVTPRSTVCDEQGVGKWAMWKRFDSVKSIVDQYVDEPYRKFLALPYHEVDKLKADELFYWFTPRCDTSYIRMAKTGDDRNYYKELFDKTMAHYQAVVAKLQKEGKTDESNFLSLSLKFAGDSEDNIYCGDGHVVVTVWGMRPKQKDKMGESKLSVELVPEVEMHTVRYELGTLGVTKQSVELKKCHGSKIFSYQVPLVKAKDGYECIGWDQNPLGAEVNGDLLFTAVYKALPKQETPVVTPIRKEVSAKEKPLDDKPKNDEMPQKHHVRFLSPDNLIIKELDVEHGKRILPGLVPQLPSVDKVMCPAWDGDPLNDIVNADRDYKAIAPKMPEQKEPQNVVDADENPGWHSVRFLNPDGSEVIRTQVMHGNRLRNEQTPPLPVVNGQECRSWWPDPLKQVIDKDTDFTARFSYRDRKSWFFRRGNGKGFWRWALRILLFILLVFLVLYIAYLCNPCSK